jgi:ADP-ribosylglycohydrolase
MKNISAEPDDSFETSIVLAFYYLKECFSLKDSLRDIMKKGGDISINAAIVGGLLGALHGKDSIPEHLRHALTEFNP